MLCSTFYHEHVLVKEPGTAASTPWHHDQSYYPVDGQDVCSLWIPVDPVSYLVSPWYTIAPGNTADAGKQTYIILLQKTLQRS